MERNTAKRTLEKLLSVCICLCMLGAMLPAQVFAEEADTAQTETVQDTAPKDTVYLSSADDLIQLAKNCRLDSWSQNRTVVLEADIDLSSVDFNGIPSFGGTWEGQNHVITGLSLSQDGSVQGLFRYVQQGALVRDMTVKGRIKPGGTRASVGGIAGSNAGTLHNCRFEGVSSGASVVGGIAGTNLAAGVIESCTTTGSVYGAHFIGGIAGENHGIIANCTNTSSVNTTVEQNDIDLSSLTLNDLIGTENVADITDIGGIAGQSGGVIRACMNRGTVGYQHMGYNVGGIAGSQTGYIEGCVNYGTVYARKEGGGIVGQMEPSSTLEYTKDTLQELSDEMSTLQTLVNRACDDASAASSDLSNQLEALKNNVTSSRNAIENLLKQAENGVSIGSQTIKTDLSQFKQDLKNTNLPGADDGDNAADSDTVIDYSEATPPSDTDPVDPNYTLSPSEEPAQSADLSTPDESSTAAQDTAVKTFEMGVAGGDLPSLQKTSVDGLSILDAFLEIGFVASKGEARRLIKQSGLKLNDKVISDENYVLSASDVVDGQVKLSQGKKKHGLIKVA